MEDRVAGLTPGEQHAALAAAVGAAMGRVDPLAERLQRVTEAIVHHLDAAFARIWILDEATEVLGLQARFSWVPTGRSATSA